MTSKKKTKNTQPMFYCAIYKFQRNPALCQHALRACWHKSRFSPAGAMLRWCLLTQHKAGVLRFFLCHSGTTMWRCGTEWTRAASWWGSTVGKSPRLPSSRLETNSSSSLCQITRRTGQASPSDTRSSRPVSGLLWDSSSPPQKKKSTRSALHASLFFN